MVVMGFFALINVYTLRVNLNVAIVDMVNSTYLREQKAAELEALANSTSFVANITKTGTYCEADSDSSSEKQVISDGPFLWDEKQQFTITGSFYYGYICTQILGGMLAQRFGGKYVLLVDIFLVSLLTLLTPAVTYAGGMPALVAIRVIEGLLEGVSFPALNAMLGNWAPPMETSRMATFVFAGAQIGTLVGMSLTGLMGWKLSFYVFGVLGIVWSIMWFFLVYNGPSVHPRISSAERQFLESTMGKKKKSTLKVPWLALIKSMPMHAICVAHFTTQWGYYTLLNNLPQYFKHIMRFNLKAIGILSGTAYFAMWVVVVSSGQLADFLRSRKIMTTTNVRKLFFAVGFLVPAICLVATGFVDCTKYYLAVFLIILGVGAIGMAWSAWNVNHLDLAPPYAGTLLGITNTLGTIPGFVGTEVVSAFTSGNQTMEAWRNVFYITAGINVFGTVFFLIFGSGELQPWGKLEQPTSEGGVELDGIGELAVPLREANGGNDVKKEALDTEDLKDV